jgi:hypothetical protein
MSLLQIVLTGNGPEVQNLQVLGQRHIDLVDVGKLVPLAVDDPTSFAPNRGGQV